MDFLISKIKEYLSAHSYGFVDIPEESVVKIYSMIKDGILFDPKTGIEYLYCGVYHKLTLRDQKEAIKLYKDAMEHGCVFAMGNLGAEYKNNMEYDIAEKYFKMAAAHGCSKYFRQLADCYYRNEKYENIINEFSETTNDFVIKLLISSYYKLGQYHKAIKSFKTIKDGPVYMYYDIASCYKKVNQNTNYVLTLDEGAKKGCVNCAFEIGKKLYDDNEFTSSLLYFLIGSRQNHDGCNFYIAKIYIAEYNDTEAEHYLSKFAYCIPVKDYSYHMKAHKLLGDLFKRHARIQECIDSYSKIAGPNYPKETLYLVDHYYEKQDYDNMLTVLNKIKDLDNPKINYYYGLYHCVSGNTEEMLINFEMSGVLGIDKVFEYYISKKCPKHLIYLYKLYPSLDRLRLLEKTLSNYEFVLE